MKYLPFENVTYQTSLDAKEVLSRIVSILDTRNTSTISRPFRSGNGKDYEGGIDGNTFYMSRIIGYRNSFLPEISGVVKEVSGETEVNVKMRLQPAVLVLTIVWLAGVFLVLVGAGIVFFKKGDFNTSFLIPLAMLLFGYALTTGGFKYESVKSKKYLADLFEAQNTK